jgi:uroporphyrinogen decarboxylase
MIKKERVLATIERQKVDRPAKWLGIPTKEALPQLFKEFNVSNIRDLKLSVDDDIWDLEMPYHSPTSNAIYMAFNWKQSDEYTLTGEGFFASHDNINDFNWPDPSKYIDSKECKKLVDEVPEGYAKMGVIWCAHFQDACAAFGMEEALIRMKTDPELFEAVIDRITEFYLEANKIFYEATKDKLDLVLIGNDFGTQESLICDPIDLRKFVFKGTKALIDQAHSHGLKVIHHSCGAIRPIINDLIECGADVIHPIQALAKGMEPYSLKEEFGQRVSFCGGVDAQHLLVHGTKNDVAEKVKELEQLFPTGLIISPSHEAILVDVPPKNVRALMKGE